MFNSTHYVPILKSKQGEFDSLAELSSICKGAITPLIEVVPFPEEDEEEEEEEDEDAVEFDPEKYLKRRVIKPITTKWGTENNIFICHSLFKKDDCTLEITKGIHSVTYIFNALRVAGVKAIPVTTRLADDKYQYDIREIIKQDKRGLCIRLLERDWSVKKVPLKGRIEKMLNFFGLKENEVDLVIDLQDVKGSKKDSMAASVADVINNMLPNPTKWRTLTVTGSSFPINLSKVAKHSEYLIPRTEWEIWKQLWDERKKLERMPTYSDYTVLHPELPKLDLQVINRSAQIRYTIDQQWLIIKGEGVKKGGFQQPHILCKILTKHDEYRGKKFSWGDEYIHKCSRNEKGPGNPSTWRKVENSHHITLVTNQLSSLGGK